MRHSVAAALLLTGFALLPGAAPRAESPLAEAEVRAFMTELEHASRARDLARLTAALAPDCRIELRAEIDGHEQVTLLTRDEYVELLSTGYAALKNLEQYDYELSNVRVTLESDPPGATVVSEVTETIVFAGKRLVTESVETSRVERRAGALRLVAVSALTTGHRDAGSSPSPPVERQSAARRVAAGRLASRRASA
jgi:hypothetical protein